MTPIHPHHLAVRQRLVAKDPARRGWLVGDNPPLPPAPTPPPAKTPRGRCAYLGDLVEKVAGCNGGPRCKFECDHPNPTKRVALPTLVRPGFECQQCPHWSSSADPAEVALDDR